ncbi:MAG: hypothetical protein PARBB_00958 [Parabacteroides distasonis]|uniref:DUF4249 domain-containing protein n=1 Tax=Parabacteroides sp. TaxID=1869337 RepID=UPI002579FEE8|nr:DUF4249 domain-containing protein [Parabacteroides sp.]
MKRLTAYWLFLSVFVSCISDFTPEVEGVRGILVVDGMITNGESVVRLSRSVGILDTLRGDEVIADALMNVECSNGVLFPAVYEGNGSYRIHTGDLDPDLGYRLNFSLGEKDYQSTFLKPMRTAEIDSVSWQKAGLEKPVTIHVTTHASRNESPYYRWSYQEVWEVRSELFANAGYIDGKFMMFERDTPKNTYYCWGRDSSKMIILDESTRLIDNVIPQKKLLEIPCVDERLAELYYIEVSQMQLREDSYRYYRLLQDEIERTGGLFNVVMSAGDNGNVYCLSDPKEVTVGYVEVCNVTKKALYIPFSRDIYEGHGMPCWTYSAKEYPSLPWYSYPSVVATPSCVDCRERYNATKNKPSWWPTDHL